VRLLGVANKAAMPAGSAPGAAPASPNSAVVGKLVNFLKEYHLKGRSKAIRKMLQTVCVHRNMNSEGPLASADVEAALKQFDSWLLGGMYAMPVWYRPPNGGRDEQAVISACHGDATVELGCGTVVDTSHEDYRQLRQRVAPQSLRPDASRERVGWFAPARDEVWLAKFAFPEKGDDQYRRSEGYMPLAAGDQIVQAHEDNGWAWGFKVLRGSTKTETGWFPTAFVELRNVGAI